MRVKTGIKKFYSMPQVGGKAGTVIAPGLDTATQAWITASGVVSPTQQTRVNDLIVAMKGGTYGNYFNLMDRMWLFAGESNSTQARTDLKTATTLMTNINGMVLSANGYTGNATDRCLDTAYIPSVHGSNYTQDSATMLIYLKTASSSNFCVMGTTDTTDTKRAYMDIGVGSAGILLNSNLVTPTAAIMSPGMYIINRGSSSAVNGIENAVPFGRVDVASTGVPTQKFIVGAALNSTGGLVRFVGDTIMMAALGGALTNLQAIEFSKIINAYMTAWGVNTFTNPPVTSTAPAVTAETRSTFVPDGTSHPINIGANELVVITVTGYSLTAPCTASSPNLGTFNNAFYNYRGGQVLWKFNGSTARTAEVITMGSSQPTWHVYSISGASTAGSNPFDNFNVASYTGSPSQHATISMTTVNPGCLLIANGMSWQSSADPGWTYANGTEYSDVNEYRQVTSAGTYQAWLSAPDADTSSMIFSIRGAT